MAIALMDALVTPMPQTSVSAPLPPTRPISETRPTAASATPPAYTDRMAYAHSEGVAVSAPKAEVQQPLYATPTPLSAEAFVDTSSTPAVFEGPILQPVVSETRVQEATVPTVVSPPEAIIGNNPDVVFPDVPTAAVREDYLSMYDLMPLAPTSRPVVEASTAPATGRREIERKAVALSGQGRPFRTQPFNPNASATNSSPATPHPASSGFSELVVPTTDHVRVGSHHAPVDDSFTIHYENPIEPAPVPAPAPAPAPDYAHAVMGYAIPERTAAVSSSAPPSYNSVASSTSAYGSYPTLPPAAAPVSANSGSHVFANYPPPASYSYQQGVESKQSSAAVGAATPVPVPLSVPVAVGATEADLQNIMRRNANAQRGADDPTRLEKGKKRSLQLENLLAMSNLFHGSAYSSSQVSHDSKAGNCHVQVLRSSSLWSIGARTECSIQDGWVNAINEAEKFIYIETEFFTGGGMAGTDVKNVVVQALLKKMVEKASSGQPFRVIVILPLTGMGNFLESEASRVAMQRQYMTICRGPHSLLYQFVQRLPGVDPSDYISFFSLRNWGVMNNRVVSQQLSIGSKIILVDDRVLIVGSASVSDRSLMGDRNSEVKSVYSTFLFININSLELYFEELFWLIIFQYSIA